MQSNAIQQSPKLTQGILCLLESQTVPQEVIHPEHDHEEWSKPHKK